MEPSNNVRCGAERNAIHGLRELQPRRAAAGSHRPPTGRPLGRAAVQLAVDARGPDKSRAYMRFTVVVVLSPHKISRSLDGPIVRAICGAATPRGETEMPVSSNIRSESESAVLKVTGAVR